MIQALVPLADGCEEMEAVIIIDTLRRARWNVVTAGTTGRIITASRGVVLTADSDWKEIDPAAFDALIIPGGTGGTQRLQEDATVLAAVRRFAETGRLLGAICAGPLVLQSAGVLAGRQATCHPAVRDQFDGIASDARVVIDGNIITSQAPGTAFEFALALIRALDGDDAMAAVIPGLVLPPAAAG